MMLTIEGGGAMGCFLKRMGRAIVDLRDKVEKRSRKGLGKLLYSPVKLRGSDFLKARWISIRLFAVRISCAKTKAPG